MSIYESEEDLEFLDESQDDDETPGPVSAGVDDDFLMTRRTNSLAEDYKLFARVMSKAGISSGPMHQLLTMIETIRQAYGDKDEMLARLADDLTQAVFTTLREITSKPSRTAVRCVIAMEEGADRDSAILEFITSAADLVPLFASDEYRTRFGLVFQDLQ